MMRALEIISEIACDTPAFLEAFLSSSKSNYLPLRNFSTNRTDPRRRIQDTNQENNKYYVLLSKLKKDGLIASRGKRGSGWDITKAGLQKLDLLHHQIQDGFPTAKKYTCEKSNSLIIIGFDIPEKQRRKRNWVRRVLIELGFKMLQKSVWIGKIKAPKEFLDDVKNLKMMDYLEIFSVGQSGTIRHLI